MKTGECWKWRSKRWGSHPDSCRRHTLSPHRRRRRARWIYRGITSAARIRAGLVSALPASTPVAVIQRATLPAQRQCLTTLGELPDRLAACGLGSPAIMVVGDVVLGVRAALQDAALAA